MSISVRTVKYFAWTLLVAAMLLRPGEASACHGQDNTGRSVACLTSLYTAITTTVFVTAQIVYAVDDENDSAWLPPAWAWSELVVGGAVPIVGGSVAIGLAAANSDDVALDVVWGSASVLVGTYFLTHGILSLLNYPEPSPDQATGIEGLQVSVWPIRDGVEASLGFTF